LKLGTLVCLTGTLFIPAAAEAATISTLFASNNSGSLGGAVYFNLTVLNNPITITGFTTNTAEVAAFTWNVYLTDPGGTHVGNESSAAAWTLSATGSGTGLGVNNPTPVTLDSPFSLLANSTYGVALVLGPTAGHDYTNGNGSNQNYSNADLSLTMGSATNVSFTGPVFTPRVWNGSIDYDVQAVPEPSTASLLLLGGSLALAARRRLKRS